MLPWSNKITKTFITKYLLETAKSPVVVGEKQILGIQKVIIFRNKEIFVDEHVYIKPCSIVIDKKFTDNFFLKL